MNSLVSICIPAYRQPELLGRCLNSVAAQTHKHSEVLITDDSPDEGVKIIVERFRHVLNITYVKNVTQLGSPANWNAALKMAKGEYVMLLHHDDAFAANDSLALFLHPFQKDPSIDFVFARNPSVEILSGGKAFNASFFEKFYRSPDLLLVGNFIGAPSNVMVKSSAVEPYHTRYKWIVDIEFYIRLFRNKKRLSYIDKKLIDIGVHEGQISNSVVNDNSILLYEYISYAAENGLNIRNLKLYDFYWRLLRNAGIRNPSQLESTSGVPLAEVPAFIKSMVGFQKKIPVSVLRKGLGSKMLMFIGYIRHYTL